MLPGIAESYLAWPAALRLHVRNVQLAACSDCMSTYMQLYLSLVVMSEPVADLEVGRAASAPLPLGRRTHRSTVV